MDTDRFIVHVKTQDVYKEFAEDVETRLDIIPKKKITFKNYAPFTKMK